MKYVILYLEKKDTAWRFVKIWTLSSDSVYCEYTAKCCINLISCKSFMKNRSAEYTGKQFSTHNSLFNDHGIALILLLNDVEICHLSQFYWLREKMKERNERYHC